MEHNKTRCLVFDLDGTLSDTLPDAVSAVNLMRREFELPALPPDRVKAMLDLGLPDFLRLSTEGTEVTEEEAEEVFLEHYRNALNEEAALFPGVFPGLRALKSAGWRLALLSSKPEDLCKFILFDSGIGGYFDLISGGGSDYPLKPDPSPLFGIMELLGAEKENTWMIGDGAVDLETARRAGVNSGFVTYGYGDPGEERPRRIFHSFDEVCAFFTGPAAG